VTVANYDKEEEEEEEVEEKFLFPH
jgi:hypothetical protein